MKFNALTLTLQNFIAAFNSGYGRLAGPAHGLLALLVGIEVVLLGLWAALGGGDSPLSVLRKILHIGVWVWIVNAFPSLAKAFVESLVQAGLTAGGGGDVSLIMDPSRIAGYGLDATEALTQKMGDLGMTDISDLLVYGFGYLAILACFFLMAINVFLAVLEYYLFATLVGILLPFGLLQPTKFLAEKAIGAVVSAGVKLMTLAFLTAAVEPVLQTIHFAGPEIKFNELWAVFLTVSSLAVLCWKAPSLASSLLAGSPSLGHGDVMHTSQAAAGAVGAAAQAGQLALRGAGAVASGGLAAVRAGAAMVGVVGSSFAGRGASSSGASSAASSLGAIASGGGGGDGGGGGNGGGGPPAGGAGGGGSPGASPSTSSSSPSAASAGASASLVMSSMGRAGSSVAAGTSSAGASTTGAPASGVRTASGGSTGASTAATPSNALTQGPSPLASTVAASAPSSTRTTPGAAPPDAAA